MAEILISIGFGVIGYLAIKFVIDPVLKIMTLRQEMHEAILQYSNVWGIDPNDSDYSKSRIHNARERFRELAAKGTAEYENLIFSRWYFLAKLYLYVTDIKINKAAEKFWAIEADAAQPDGEFRKKIITEIRDSLHLPQNKKNLDVKEVA